MTGTKSNPRIVSFILLRHPPRAQVPNPNIDLKMLGNKPITTSGSSANSPLGLIVKNKRRIAVIAVNREA